jgi:hypothetical protein
MMNLITEGGRRVDRKAELATLIHGVRMTAFERLTDLDRQRLKRLLDLDHLEREIIRFGYKLEMKKTEEKL